MGYEDPFGLFELAIELRDSVKRRHNPYKQPTTAGPTRHYVSDILGLTPTRADKIETKLSTSHGGRATIAFSGLGLLGIKYFPT